MVGLIGGIVNDGWGIGLAGTKIKLEKSGNEAENCKVGTDFNFWMSWIPPSR